MIRMPAYLVLLACAVLAPGDGVVLHAQGSSPVLQGIVRSERSGAPLPGVRITATARDGLAAAHAMTGRDGRLELAVPARGEYRLVFQKAGYAPHRMAGDGLSPASPLEVGLVTGAVVTGRVLTAEGHPMPDAGVQIRRVDDAAAAEPIRITAITDDLGEYRAGSLPAGRYDVNLDPVMERMGTAGNLSGASGINMARVLPALALSMRPGRPGGPPPASVVLRSGEEVVQDLTASSPAAPVQSASMAAGLSAGADVARKLLGLPPLDPATAGRVTGTVVGPRGSPPRQAIVRLVPQANQVPALAVVNEDGSYEFPAVEPGVYRVVASAAGTMEAEHGASAGSRTGGWVRVRARQHVERVDIVLPRSAVIAGRIVDGNGEPLEGLTVDVWRSRTQGGRAVLEPVTSIVPRTTDDRGLYRVHGLPAGRYYVVASDRAPAEPLDRQTSSPGGILTAATDAVAAALASPARPLSYYPGRSTVQGASVVVVDVGLDAFGVDFAFNPGPTSRVAGVVLDATGTPVSAHVSLWISSRSGAPRPPPHLMTAGADGTFAFPHVAPGEYVIQAQKRDAGPQGLLSGALSFGGGIAGASSAGLAGAPPGTADLTAMFFGPPWTAETAPEFATAFVTVTGGEMAPITLHGAKGSAIRGRLSLEGPGEAAPMTSFSLAVISTDSDQGRSAYPPVRVAADGTFEAHGLVGAIRVLAAGAPNGWWLKSVRIDGVDAVDQPVTLAASAAAAREATAVFSSAPSGVSGRVLDRDREPASAAAVLAFPVDWTLWYDGSRHVRHVAAENGRFSVSALPPGSYYVVALDAAVATLQTDWRDFDALNRLTPLARQVTVNEGTPATLDLTVVDVPR